MSITLITGVPGSGKTLYAIDKLLRALIGATSDKVLENGDVQKIPRILYTNINGLLLDHEQIEGGGVWNTLSSTSPLHSHLGTADNSVELSGKTWVYEGNPQGLRNWIQWAKPGSVICYDEFQKFWPPRPNGAPIPPDLQTLDTHRHMGVDFILITQNCMNVDRHILGLVDRHLHVRRVANMNMAVVYEWDHASKSLLYKNALTKSPWRYNKGVFKLYKSAELHTKQKRNLPGLVWFVLIGICGAVYATPTLYNRIHDRAMGKPAAAATAAALDQPKPGQKMEYSKDGVRYTVEKTVTIEPVVTAAAPLVPVAAPVLAGCAAVAKKCACVDAGGYPVPVAPGFCEAQILGNSVPGQKTEIPLLVVNTLDIRHHESQAQRVVMDADLLAFVHKSKLESR